MQSLWYVVMVYICTILLMLSLSCSGYLYCHACSDFQALMPRTGSESGYDPAHVCGYCIELLNSMVESDFLPSRLLILSNQVTAAGGNQLKASPLSKLKSYADSYNINISRAVEKGDIVEAIIRARVRAWTSHALIQ